MRISDWSSDVCSSDLHALVRRQASIPRPVPNPVIAANATDVSLSTWGIQAVGADKSGYSGKGVRLAILDTGIDLEHPDFAGRKKIGRASCRERVCSTCRSRWSPYH